MSRAGYQTYPAWVEWDSIKVLFSFCKTTHVFCRQAEMAPEQLCWQLWANTFPFQKGDRTGRWAPLCFPDLLAGLLCSFSASTAAESALCQPWRCYGSAIQGRLLWKTYPISLEVGDSDIWSSLFLSWDKVLEFRSFSTSPKAKIIIHQFSSFSSLFLLFPPSCFLYSSPLSSFRLFQFLQCFPSCLLSGSSLWYPHCSMQGLMAATLPKIIAETRNLYLSEAFT